MTHHPNAKRCLDAVNIRDLIVYTYALRRLTPSTLLEHVDARIARYEREQSTTPTCAACCAEMCNDPTAYGPVAQ